MSKTNTACSFSSCIIYLCVIFLPGFWSVNFLTNVVFCKNAPWYADALVGFFLGSITFPLVVGVWFLRCLGVDVHWFCS